MNKSKKNITENVNITRSGSFIHHFALIASLTQELPWRPVATGGAAAPTARLSSSHSQSDAAARASPDRRVDKTRSKRASQRVRGGGGGGGRLNTSRQQKTNQSVRN